MRQLLVALGLGRWINYILCCIPGMSQRKPAKNDPVEDELLSDDLELVNEFQVAQVQKSKYKALRKESQTFTTDVDTTRVNAKGDKNTRVVQIESNKEALQDVPAEELENSFIEDPVSDVKKNVPVSPDANINVVAQDINDKENTPVIKSGDVPPLLQGMQNRANGIPLDNVEKEVPGSLDIKADAIKVDLQMAEIDSGIETSEFADVPKYTHIRAAVTSLEFAREEEFENVAFNVDAISGDFPNEEIIQGVETRAITGGLRHLETGAINIPLDIAVDKETDSQYDHINSVSGDTQVNNTNQAVRGVTKVSQDDQEEDDQVAVIGIARDFSIEDVSECSHTHTDIMSVDISEKQCALLTKTNDVKGVLQATQNGASRNTLKLAIEEASEKSNGDAISKHFPKIVVTPANETKERTKVCQDIQVETDESEKMKEISESIDTSFNEIKMILEKGENYCCLKAQSELKNAPDQKKREVSENSDTSFHEIKMSLEKNENSCCIKAVNESKSSPDIVTKSQLCKTSSTNVSFIQMTHKGDELSEPYLNVSIEPDSHSEDEEETNTAFHSERESTRNELRDAFFQIEIQEKPCSQVYSQRHSPVHFNRAEENDIEKSIKSYDDAEDNVCDTKIDLETDLQGASVDPRKFYKLCYSISLEKEYVNVNKLPILQNSEDRDKIIIDTNSKEHQENAISENLLTSNFSSIDVSAVNHNEVTHLQNKRVTSNAREISTTDTNEDKDSQIKFETKKEERTFALCEDYTVIEKEVDDSWKASIQKKHSLDLSTENDATVNSNDNNVSQSQEFFSARLSLEEDIFARQNSKANDSLKASIQMEKLSNLTLERYPISYSNNVEENAFKPTDFTEVLNEKENSTGLKVRVDNSLSASTKKKHSWDLSVEKDTRIVANNENEISCKPNLSHPALSLDEDIDTDKNNKFNESWRASIALEHAWDLSVENAAIASNNEDEFLLKPQDMSFVELSLEQNIDTGLDDGVYDSWRASIALEHAWDLRVEKGTTNAASNEDEFLIKPQDLSYAELSLEESMSTKIELKVEDTWRASIALEHDWNLSVEKDAMISSNNEDGDVFKPQDLSYAELSLEENIGTVIDKEVDNSWRASIALEHDWDLSLEKDAVISANDSNNERHIKHQDYHAELSLEEDTIDETIEDIDLNVIDKHLSNGKSYVQKPDEDIMLLLSLALSTQTKSINGTLYEVNGFTEDPNSTPKKVRVHVRLLPSKRLLHKTKWVRVEQNKAVFIDEFRKTLITKEEILRVRVYSEKKCIGNGFVKVNSIQSGENKIWIPLINDGNSL